MSQRRNHPAYLPPSKGDVTAAYRALLLSDLPDCAKRVGASLIGHVNNRTGQCNPGQHRLEQTTGLSRSGVQKGLRLLREAQIVLILEAGKGTWSTCYQINWGLLRDKNLAWEVEFFEAREREPLAPGSEAHACKDRSPQMEPLGPTDESPNSLTTLSTNSIGETERDPPLQLSRDVPNRDLVRSVVNKVRNSQQSRLAAAKREADAEKALDDSLRQEARYGEILSWLPEDLHRDAVTAEQKSSGSGKKIVLNAFASARHSNDLKAVAH